MMRRSMKYDLKHPQQIFCIDNLNSTNHGSSPPTTTESYCLSSTMANNGLAVIVDSIEFCYSKNIPLLKNVSINVPKGKIYSLLGSNGCGKTTLLNILLGRLKPLTGDIKILGHSPGRLLNHRIGYMPQELGLNPFLHIQDTFNYFAQVNHIKDKTFIQEQIRKYLEMLDLHDPKKCVGELSGGQKRLLSLGVTLIYKPKILLLDEPTVGIDSLIRSKIWTHLRQLCYSNQTTVIITTHYIDEAKQSDLVGFLHEGQLLAEESPDVLMRTLNCKTLEQVFLRLCFDNRQQDNSNGTLSAKAISIRPSIYFRYQNGSRFENTNLPNGKSINNTNTMIEDMNNNDAAFPNQYSEKSDPQNNDPFSPQSKENNNYFMIHNDIDTANLQLDQPCARHFLNFDHLYALLCREWYFFRRNLWLFLFYIVMPVLTVYLFDSSYGRTPHDVPIAIFNGDQSDFQPPLADIFLEEFDDDMVYLNHYQTEVDAIKSVELGKNVIAITFRSNFSRTLVDRYYDFHAFEKKVNDIPDGSMHLYIDHSSLLNVRYVNRSILLAFQRTIEKYGNSRGINPQIFSLPIEKKEYVYGKLEPHFQDLFTPGVIIVMLMAMNAAKAAFELIYLHQNGCLKRDINQGVRPFEILVTFLFGSAVSMFWQTLSVMFFTFQVMGVPIEGDWFSAFILVYTTALQGLFMGTLISVLFPDQVWSMLLCFTALVVIFLTSGTLWPIEGMKPILQKLFMLNPMVLPVQSFRMIMLRGWTIYNLSVQLGYVINAFYCTLLFIGASFFFHFLNI